MSKRQSKQSEQWPAVPHRYTQQEYYLYAALNGFWGINDRCAGIWLELLDHPNVVWCQWWVLGNLDPAPLTQYRASLDLLVLCARQEPGGGAMDHTVAIKKSERRASEAIIQAGEHLIAMKDMLQHGQWLDWLQTEFQMSQPTASRMMAVAEKFGSKVFNLNNLQPSVLYMLAGDSVPEPAREAVFNTAAAGVKVTIADAKAVISQYKPVPGGTKSLEELNEMFGPPSVINTAPATNGNGHVGYSFSDVVRIATSHVQRGQEAAARDVSPLRLAASNHVISDDPNYDGDEWYTPSEYIEAARTVMGGIDLDPASCDVAQEVVQAAAYYTKQDNGLAMPWMGSVWLNPPYSMPLIRQFVTKLIDQYEGGNVTEAVILTNNSSDTAWFHDLLSRYPACFTRGRVQFWRADHETFGARQGQTLFYLGSNTAEFVKMFSQFGQVVSRV